MAFILSYGHGAPVNLAMQLPEDSLPSHFSKYPRPDEIRKDWRIAKSNANLHAEHITHALQESLNSSSTAAATKAKLLDMDSLKHSRANLVDFFNFFNSEDGQKFDPEGRRRMSAMIRGRHLQSFYDDYSQICKKKKKSCFILPRKARTPDWGRIKHNMSQRAKQLKVATDDKKSRHRVNYGDFVKHTFHRKDPKDIPFVSTLGAKLKDIKPFPPLQQRIMPEFEFHSRPSDVNKKWKDDKAWSDIEAQSTIGALDAITKSSTKPRLPNGLTVKDYRAALEEHHAKMKGWQDFYSSWSGASFDSTGRRRLSASQRAALVKQLHEGIQAYQKGNRVMTWPEARDTVTKKLENAETNYERASEAKKAVFPGKGRQVKAIRNQWRNEKQHMQSDALFAKKTLEQASKAATRPDLTDTRAALKLSQRRGNNWEAFFGSEDGKLHDPEGRRRISARQHAELAKKLRNGLQVLHTDSRPWHAIKETVVERLDHANTAHAQALQEKHRDFRHGYGNFVERKASGEGISKILFVSSEEAHSKKKKEKKETASDLRAGQSSSLRA